ALLTLQNEHGAGGSVIDVDALVGSRTRPRPTRRTFAEQVKKARVPVEVLGNVTKAEAELLRKCEDPTHMVASWMIRGITVRQREGGVSVPPPILSRVYQELSNAMLGYNNALKVATTPFPFPYVCATRPTCASAQTSHRLPAPTCRRNSTNCRWLR
ncbi:MAG TPA: hypothetical protein DDW61_00785, partial [Actinobacteria bacterium]|nr:hypothetical protein [Actinomycetota bacterium]